VHIGQHRLESVRRLIGYQPWLHRHWVRSKGTVTLGEVWASRFALPPVLGDRSKTATLATVSAAGTLPTLCTINHIISARAALCA
jgi:hypothetical protein